MTITEVISRARSSVKQLFDDNILSDRYIYSVAKTSAATLIKREVNLRRLLNSDNIFTPLECLDLIKTSYTECGISCEGIVRRSKERLPTLQEGIYSYIIQGVYNADNSDEILPTTVREQINLSKLKYKPNVLYYLIKDGYLYVLNEFVENVNLYVYIADQLEIFDECEPAYEAEFKIPGYLEEGLFALIEANISRYIRQPKDITDNNLDENQ